MSKMKWIGLVISAGCFLVNLMLYAREQAHQHTMSGFRVGQEFAFYSALGLAAFVIILFDPEAPRD